MRDLDAPSCINCGWMKPAPVEENVDLAFWWKLQAEADSKLAIRSGQLMGAHIRAKSGMRTAKKIDRLIKSNPGATDSVIADLAGVSRRTVQRAKKRINA
jgi:hypothetical protein